ncbi:MAG: MltA domain-containing protein [Pseudomonadota bacterium]|nr:MltA domain-containing protein [Pseudomonadota bacterium]
MPAASAAIQGAAIGAALIAVASATLCGCAAAQPEHPIPYSQLPGALPPVPVPRGLVIVGALRSLASLPGWNEEDHLAALKAFQDGCGVAKDVRWKAVCQRARATLPIDDPTARAFFEANFQAEAAPQSGLLTAYFSPEYPAQDTPDEIFSAPVRPLPTDSEAFADRPRAEIETSPAEGARAFMKAEDLFYLQIQGSGVLVFPDGRRLKAVYSGDNGLPFTPIARPMAEAGLLPRDRLSGDAIRGWLSDHRGPEADAVMDQNARYIFFDLVPDDGREPSGASGQPLTAGRALAVDPAFHRYGALYWIDADAPTLKGAVPSYRRLALALDTGAAIRGERRADLYLGKGDKAGQEAGRVRHVLSLVRLIPVPPSTQPAHPYETPPPAR